MGWRGGDEILCRNCGKRGGIERGAFVRLWRRDRVCFCFGGAFVELERGMMVLPQMVLVFVEELVHGRLLSGMVLVGEVLRLESKA